MVANFSGRLCPELGRLEHVRAVGVAGCKALFPEYNDIGTLAIPKAEPPTARNAITQTWLRRLSWLVLHQLAERLTKGLEIVVRLKVARGFFELICERG